MTDAWSGLVAKPRYRAVLHFVHHGLDITGKQRCVMCGAVILNHSRQVLDAHNRRVDVDGRTIWGFRKGAVTTLYPPEPWLPPVTVAGHVRGARPCTIPEGAWPDA